MSDSWAVAGFDAAGIAAGIKKNGAADLALVASRVPCRAAGIFTRNAFPAAPVLFDQRVLAFNAEGIHGVLINAGCANACTGIPGDANARRSAEIAEAALGASDHTVLVMSTGVIGVQLPMERFTDGVPKVVDALDPDGWPDAAQAIMTTDTRPKLVSRSLTIDGVEVRVTGIAKGAGMIHPDMATMLSVIATDVAIPLPLLDRALRESAGRSFNRISIDGDTSTNDTVLLLANGASGAREITSADEPAYATFLEALTTVSRELAQAIVRDGEGATRFVTVEVKGAVDDEEAHRAANTIATSPLVKTAFFGGDANWGRILAAAGRSGSRIEPKRTALFICGGVQAEPRSPELQLVEAGTPLNYDEAVASAIFAQPEIDVRVELGLGEGSATVWTSDLSYEYVRINGDYRT